MQRIINLIEKELERQESEIELLRWEIENLQAELKGAKEALEQEMRRRPFGEVINEKEKKDGKI